MLHPACLSRNPNGVRHEDDGRADAEDLNPFGPGTFDDEITSDGDNEHDAPLCHARSAGAGQ